MAPVPKPKRDRTKHFFKEWREKAGLTQDQAMGRLEWSQSKISRLENGETPYNEDDLAAAAFAYNCEPSDLITVNPLVEREVVDLVGMIRRANPEMQRKAIRIVSELLSTGTDS